MFGRSANFELLPSSPDRGTGEQRGNPKTVRALVRMCPLLRLCSLPEDRRPYAHAGCSLFDCYFEIVRHTHRKNGHADVRKASLGNAVANLTDLAEVVPCAFPIFCVRRDGHQALNLQIAPTRSALEDLFKVV